MIDLHGKWALVTGASRGIGRCTSLALAKQGCNLVLHSRHKESLESLKKEAEQEGVRVFALQQDFAVPGAADELLKKVAKQGIEIDILFNNAAVNLSVDRENAGLPLHYALGTQEEYQQTMQVNVIVPALLSCRLIPRMRERGYGRIVNLTSGIHGSCDHLAYSISKGAIDKLSGDLAEEVEGSGVAVSAVGPGWCQTYLGGEGAKDTVENTCPGMLVPVCMEEGSNGKYFDAQDFAGLTLEEAVERGKTYHKR